MRGDGLVGPTEEPVGLGLVVGDGFPRWKMVALWFRCFSCVVVVVDRSEWFGLVSWRFRVSALRSESVGCDIES